MKRKFLPLIASTILFIFSEIIFLNLKINFIFYFLIFTAPFLFIIFHLIINEKDVEKKYWYLILQFILFSLISYFFCFSFTSSFFSQIFLITLFLFLFIFLRNVYYLFNQPMSYDFLLDKSLKNVLVIISLFCGNVIFFYFIQINLNYICLIFLVLFYFWEYFYLIKSNGLPINKINLLSILGLSVVIVEFFVSLSYFSLNIYFNSLLILLIFGIFYLLWTKKKFLFKKI